MQTQKHTPGPWTDNGDGTVKAADGTPITDCAYYLRADNSTTPIYANARLIAAAPAMLEALEQSVRALDLAKEHAQVRRAIEAAVAAIRAAKGE